VWAFGSRVTGKSSDRSDIDIGIEGQAPVPPGVLAKIEEDINALPTLYKIEVVDFKQVSQGFRKVALRKIEYLETG
jgi:predicted nucleotidyltransferase